MIKKNIRRIVGFFLNYVGVNFVPKSKTCKYSVERAEEILQQHFPDTQKSAIWERKCDNVNFDLTIIVPVYNVEKYLVKCLDSIINQKTIYSYNVIIVNDCSTDDSSIILNKYVDKPNVKIINHLVNQGLSAARNTGLLLSEGKYIMFVDSDDYLPEDAVENLMKTAFKLNADIVQGGYDTIDCITGDIIEHKNYNYQKDVPPNGVLSGMAWGKVYKSYLFDSVCFPETYWFEDTIITALITHLAKSIVTISDTVYFYLKNPNGITGKSKGKPKSIDTLYVHRCVLQAREHFGFDMTISFYEHLLRMIILSYKRTISEPLEVRISLFLQFSEMLRSVRKDEFKVKKVYRNLEKAILNKDYAKYSFLCKWL